MAKRIAIIGASDLQLPLIEKAKEMGFETHVFAWKVGDAGERAADFFYPISIVEWQQILAVCRHIKPVAVASIASDLAAITVNRVANSLGLSSNPSETAIIATNKYEMRRAFQNAQLPTPLFLKVKEHDDLSIVKEFRLPIIVKPTDRSGSRGIYKLQSFDNLGKKIEYACKESFEGCAIIEEYIEGDEYSCECISQNGIHHCLAFTKKFTTGAPHFIEIGHMEPSGLNDEICLQAKQMVFKALDALHVKCGASHSEFKVDSETGEIHLIEIGARMGGDCIGSDLVQLSQGYDYVKMAIEAALGENIDLTQGPYEKVAAVRYIMNINDYQHYQNINKQAVQGRVVRQSAIKLPINEPVLDSSTRFGFFVATGDTPEELGVFVGLPSWQ